MTITEALIAGVVQGLTEFLPVSSSGHLVLVHRFFGLSEASIFFDICLHVGTLAAVVLYFRKDILSLVRERRADWLLYIAIGTVPAVIAALFFEKHISLVFLSPRKVAPMFIVTALVLFAGQISQLKKAQDAKGPTVLRSIIVGISQAFALLPGISRSGMTVSTGRLGGMNAENAFRFSFLLSIPAILGALAYKALKIDLGSVVLSNIGGYVSGMMIAFIVGLASLALLWRVIKTRRLFIFGIYCLLLGISGLLFWE
ncbi:MAG: undecaprenyl-diphosphate phosphatase [Candidatus Omnitrophota bacterium]